MILFAIICLGIINFVLCLLLWKLWSDLLDGDADDLIAMLFLSAFIIGIIWFVTYLQIKWGSQIISLT